MASSVTNTGSLHTIEVIRRRYRRLILGLCIFAAAGGIAVGVVGDTIVPSIRYLPFALFVGIPLLGFLLIGFVAIPRSRRRLLQARPEFSEEELCSDIDPNAEFPPSLIVDLARGLSQVYRLPVGKLRAADRFKEDLSLAPDLLFDYADEDRLDWATSRIGTVRHTIPLASISTVGEFIRALASAVASEPSRP